jgi:preprotein translocase subunit SecE
MSCGGDGSTLMVLVVIAVMALLGLAIDNLFSHLHGV